MKSKILANLNKRMVRRRTVLKGGRWRLRHEAARLRERRAGHVPRGPGVRGAGAAGAASDRVRSEREMRCLLLLIMVMKRVVMTFQCFLFFLYLHRIYNTRVCIC
jgi:hypothetical protein